jgi:hypothetical protein
MAIHTGNAQLYGACGAGGYLGADLNAEETIPISVIVSSALLHDNFAGYTTGRQQLAIQIAGLQGRVS